MVVAPATTHTRSRGAARIALVAALLALALRFPWLGAFPFAGEISPDHDRWMGRAYVVAVLVGGLAAFHLSAHTEGLLKALCSNPRAASTIP
jgi:hypothetical protein